jgi:hypothetical protein
MLDLATIIKFFELLSFVICDSSDLEDGFEKIALYTVSGGAWRHVAFQTESGKWSSKLAEHEDLEHDSPEVLLGGEYEAIASIMKRPRRPRKHNS